jgi:hypothetical protein
MVILNFSLVWAGYQGSRASLGYWLFPPSAHLSPGKEQFR